MRKLLIISIINNMIVDIINKHYLIKPFRAVSRGVLPLFAEHLLRSETSALHYAVTEMMMPTQIDGFIFGLHYKAEITGPVVTSRAR